MLQIKKDCLTEAVDYTNSVIQQDKKYKNTLKILVSSDKQNGRGMQNILVHQSAGNRCCFF